MTSKESEKSKFHSSIALIHACKFFVKFDAMLLSQFASVWNFFLINVIPLTEGEANNIKLEIK